MARERLRLSRQTLLLTAAWAEETPARPWEKELNTGVTAFNKALTEAVNEALQER